MAYKTVSLGELCAEAGICRHIGGMTDGRTRAIEIGGITADSRRVQTGWLFVAIRGLHENATTYVPDACRRGAAAVVCDIADRDRVGEMLPEGVGLVPVSDTRAASAHLFDAWYGHPTRRACLVGVTGTNGKTSVSSMLHHILHEAGIPAGIIGTVGCIAPDGTHIPICAPDERANMTTPDPEELYAIFDYMIAHTASDVPPVIIMEVTSHALALGKVSPLSYDVGIYTNLTPEHLDFHGNMETYYAAKRRLFDKCRVGVVNADDPYVRRMLSESLPVERWLVCRSHTPDLGSRKPSATGDCCRVSTSQILIDGDRGVEFRLSTPRTRVRVKCPVPGEFTVQNAMLATAAALELGVDPTVVRQAMACYRGVKGRMERVSPDDADISVFVDFAHTPDALEKLLTCARGFARRGQRITLVFGCGGDRDRAKRPEMGRLAYRLADRVIVTSDNSRSERPEDIIRDILGGIGEVSPFFKTSPNDKGDPYPFFKTTSENKGDFRPFFKMDEASRGVPCALEVIVDRRQAIEHAVLTAREGDIILLAGKGHEAYEIDAEGKHPFSEEAIVAKAMYRRRCVEG